MSKNQEIVIVSDLHDALELSSLLVAELSEIPNVTITQRLKPSEFRDPTIVVALIAGGTSILVSLITAVATIWAARIKKEAGKEGKFRNDEIHVLDSAGTVLLVLPAHSSRAEIKAKVLEIHRPVSRIALVHPI